MSLLRLLMARKEQEALEARQAASSPSSPSSGPALVRANRLSAPLPERIRLRTPNQLAAPAPGAPIMPAAAARAYRFRSSTNGTAPRLRGISTRTRRWARFESS